MITEPITMGWIQNSLKTASLQIAENNREFDQIMGSIKSSQVCMTEVNQYINSQFMILVVII